MIPHTSAVQEIAASDLDHLVISVLASLSKDAVSFQRASNLYNSDFFRDESAETKARLCTALFDYFAPVGLTNLFWQTNRRD